MEEVKDNDRGIIAFLNRKASEKPIKVDTGMMSQKQRAQFISYMEESLKEAKRNGR